MIGAPNSPNLSLKVRVMKEAPAPSVSEEIADIFRNYNIDLLKIANSDELDSERSPIISHQRIRYVRLMLSMLSAEQT